eukprot:3825122-Prymnesium_polylepis.1
MLDEQLARQVDHGPVGALAHDRNVEWQQGLRRAVVAQSEKLACVEAAKPRRVEKRLQREGIAPRGLGS